MADLYLNKAQKFFYFQTRIHHRQAVDLGDQWRCLLETIEELQGESGIEVYGLVINRDRLHMVFSTPYFNENILILDWEMRIRKRLKLNFSRPISCEPVGTEAEVKRVLGEIYRGQFDIQKNAVQWLNPFNSLKLLLEGSAQARLFNDPFKIIFQPAMVLQFQNHQEKQYKC